MWIRKRPQPNTNAETVQAQPGPLKEAVRNTRIEMAEKSAVVVDLRDAELARLEILNDALDPLFAEISPEIDLFDRGISRGDTPRLWIDAIAHVGMGRDKRRYRFVQDTRFGRKVLAESNDSAEIVAAVTHYVAARLVERERALATTGTPADTIGARRRSRLGMVFTFVAGLAIGFVVVIAALWIIASQLPG